MSMLKIIYPVCCGIDVHKKFVVATIVSSDKNNVTTYQTRKFSTFTDDLLQLEKWLKENNCKDVCMESTGKYWIPIFNVLENSCKVTLANPKFVRNIPGKKTDKKDSLWLADLHKHGLVPGSFIPPPQIRQLRDLVRYRQKLINFKTSEKNRFQNSLTVSNVMISNVVSDIFGKSASSIIKHLIDNPDCQDFDFTSMLHGSMKHKAEDIAKSINGKISKYQAQKMNICLQHLDDIDSLISKLESSIYELAIPFSNEVNIISSMPGIKNFSAICIISEIGTDMSVFHSSKHLCSWAGLTPQSNESTGKKKSVRISRAGAYIKPLLVQCADAAIRDKKFPYFRLRYEAIKKRRGHKRAIIAIARMMLTCIYHMLSKKEFFNFTLYETKLPYKPKSLPPSLSIDEAILLLKQHGYDVKPISEAIDT
jgi:transposase